MACIDHSDLNVSDTPIEENAVRVANNARRFVGANGEKGIKLTQVRAEVFTIT